MIVTLRLPAGINPEFLSICSKFNTNLQYVVDIIKVEPDPVVPTPREKLLSKVLGLGLPVTQELKVVLVEIINEAFKD